MFDTIAGLPVHALMVHAVVVLLPVMAVVTVAVAARAGWRSAALPVAVLDGVMVVLSLVAKESGEKLQRRLTVLANGVTVAKTHGEQGDLIPLFAFALFAASVLVWFAGRRPGLRVPALAVSAVVAVATIGWTVVTGHSGAESVWAQLIASTK